MVLLDVEATEGIAADEVIDPEDASTRRYLIGTGTFRLINGTMGRDQRRSPGSTRVRVGESDSGVARTSPRDENRWGKASAPLV